MQRESGISLQSCSTTKPFIGYFVGDVGSAAMSDSLKPRMRVCDHTTWFSYQVLCMVQVGEEGNTGTAASRSIWMPMEYEAQPQWRWLDWARFYFYRSILASGTQTLRITLCFPSAEISLALVHILLEGSAGCLCFILVPGSSTPLESVHHQHASVLFSVLIVLLWQKPLNMRVPVAGIRLQSVCAGTTQMQSLWQSLHYAPWRMTSSMLATWLWHYTSSGRGSHCAPQCCSGGYPCITLG